MQSDDINPTICGCIPTHLNSSRLPRKLLLFIGEQTILERTIRRALLCKRLSTIFVLTDHRIIAGLIADAHLGPRVRVLQHSSPASNGTQRIANSLHLIPASFRVLVNIQADEPFVDPRNVDFLIDMHLSLCSPATFGAHGKEDIFFSTLHQQVKNLSYLQDPSCVKVIVNRKNNAMLFSRNVLPWNKDGKVRNNIKYYSCTGVYAYNRGRLEQYNILQDTEHQLEEDVEQLKVLDYGYVIKSFECPFFNETSINTSADYDRLRKKYEGTKG